MGEVPDGLNCEGAVFPVPDLCKAAGEFWSFAGGTKWGRRGMPACLTVCIKSSGRNKKSCGKSLPARSMAGGTFARSREMQRYRLKPVKQAGKDHGHSRRFAERDKR